MLRITAISLMLVLSVGIMLPFTQEAHGVRQTTQIGQRRHHRYRSRAWWRRYRARLKQRRLAAELAHRNKLLSLPQNISVADLSGLSQSAQPALPSVPSNATSVTTTTLPPPVMTASVPAPATNGATRPRVVNAAHAAVKAEAAPTLPGSMNLAVVAMSRPNPAFLTSREEKKMLGGVAVADLRRMVIDKMVSSGGWVVNDFVREVNGHRVFVVTGRTPKDVLTPEKTWTFYLTESGGRIYGLTTDSPVEFADRMTTEAERFIESLRAKAATVSSN
jgi:hypothetical protein